MMQDEACFPSPPLLGRLSVVLALLGLVLLMASLFVPWFHFTAKEVSLGGWTWIVDWGLWTGQTDCYVGAHNRCFWHLAIGERAFLVAGMLLCLGSIAAFVGVCLKRRQWYWMVALALLGLPVFAGWRGSLCLQWSVSGIVSMTCTITEIMPAGPVLLLLAALLEAGALLLVIQAQRKELRK